MHTRKRKRPRKPPSYRKIHVAMGHKSATTLKILGTRTVGNERRTVAEVKVLPNNVYQVYLLANDLCRQSLQDVKKAVFKYAAKRRLTIQLTVMKCGILEDKSCRES